MMKKTLTLWLLFTAATTILTSCDTEPIVMVQKTRVALVFSDVTSSLIPQENKEVAMLTADVLDHLPPGATYAVYPIQIETQRLTPIVEGKAMVETNEQANIAVKDQRRKELIRAIADLYGKIRVVRDHSSPYGKPDNHSCILNTLGFAQDQFRQFADPGRFDLELIYISDMVEECNRTPMHQPIVLARKDISKEITLAQNSALKLNLSNTRVTIIIPSTTETYLVGHRPNLDELRLFWEAVLKGCGFSDETLKDERHFYFSAGLPQRFKGD
jgi:hypothetical protein